MLAANPNATLQDQAQYAASYTQSVNSLLDLVYALLALAVLIAPIGIANTLALSIHERTRELGALFGWAIVAATRPSGVTQLVCPVPQLLIVASWPRWPAWPPRSPEQAGGQAQHPAAGDDRVAYLARSRPAAAGSRSILNLRTFGPKGHASPPVSVKGRPRRGGRVGGWGRSEESDSDGHLRCDHGGVPVYRAGPERL